MISSKSKPTGQTGVEPCSTSTENNEECCKTGNYLRHLSGQDRETSQLILEHNYSKPWTWKPETSFAKPTRTLFTSSKQTALKVICPDDDLDVETADEAQTSNLCCVEEADACEKYADELRAAPARSQQLTKEDAEDWEHRVPRVGWTTEHLRLYTNVVRALHELQLARLALIGRVDEAVQRRLAVDTAARRVRRAMASVTWDLRLTHWLHATLQEHMPTPLLAIYLEVLQTLRAKTPTLVDQMLSLSTYNRLGVPVSEELLQLLQKPWDPAASSLSEHKPRKLPLDPVLVVVPSGIGNHVGHNSRRNRFWTSQLSMLGRVTTVSTQAANLTGQSTVENMLEQLLTLTRAKVDELKTAVPSRPVILVGWNVGAAIACQAALMEPVAAVVCMGFPISTLAGRRGQADDAILDLQCPILFVIGQNAPTARQADLEELRERLRVQSGLLVVGSADEQLRVAGVKKRSEGLTQSMVDRCILDEVGDFLGSVLTQPPSSSSPPVRAATLAQTISAASSSINSNTDPSSRRQSMESVSLDSEAPDAKRSRSATPLSAAPANVSPPKVVYAAPKTETALSFNTSRSAQKRVYEGSSAQRVLLASGSSDKRMGSTLGSRQGQTGITVNIGSLASLTPIGPIRLGSGDSLSDNLPRPRTTSVRVPSTPTTHTGLTSLSSLLTSNSTKIGTNSILLTSNSTGHIKVLGGDDAAMQSRTRQLDLSRVTLLTGAAGKAAAASQGGVVMVNTGSSTASGSGSSVLLHSQQAAKPMRQQPRHPAATLIQQAKPKADQGSAKTTFLQSSSAPILLSSTPSTITSRPVASLSPATILELPVIFAKDGDAAQYTGAAALTAPLPVTLTNDVAMTAESGQDKKTS